MARGDTRASERRDGGPSWPSLARAGGRQRSRAEVRRGARPTWPRVAIVAALILLAFFASRSCQQSQIRITQEQAIGIAKRQVDFSPKETQIRLLRQGLDRRPFWFVSLSDPIGSVVNPAGFSRLAIVQVDANTGKVEEVQLQSPEDDAKQVEAAQRARAAANDDQAPP